MAHSHLTLSSRRVPPTKRPPSPREPHPDLQNEDEERNRLAAPPKSVANGTAVTSAEGKKTGFKMKLGKVSIYSFSPLVKICTESAVEVTAVRVTMGYSDSFWNPHLYQK